MNMTCPILNVTDTKGLILYVQAHASASWFHKSNEAKNLDIDKRWSMKLHVTFLYRIM